LKLRTQCWGKSCL